MRRGATSGFSGARNDTQRTCISLRGGGASGEVILKGKFLGGGVSS